MARLSRMLHGLGVIAAILSVVWYLYIQKLGCAMGTGTAPTRCPIRMPWQLGSEDLLFLFVTPFGITALLFGLSALCKRGSGSE